MYAISSTEFYFALAIALLIKALPFILVIGLIGFLYYRKKRRAALVVAAVHKPIDDQVAHDAFGRYLKSRIQKAIVEGTQEQREQATVLLAAHEVEYDTSQGAITTYVVEGKEVDFITYANSVLKRIGY